jgi:hypothetical protein
MDAAVARHCDEGTPIVIRSAQWLSVDDMLPSEDVRQPKTRSGLRVSTADVRRSLESWSPSCSSSR